MRRILTTCLLVCVGSAPLAGQETKATKPPHWDARGLGPLPRMGITSVDVSDDGKEIVVGTIAAFGDPNVVVLDNAGKIVRHYRVGQRWIDDVAFLPGGKEVIALCTMPAGRAGDRVQAFRLRDAQVLPEIIEQEGPWFFHYGDHSNHPTMKLARAENATALLAGNQIVIHRKGKEPASIRLPIHDPDTSISLAVDEAGWVVVGATRRESAPGDNLFLIDPDQKKPVWTRAVNKEVEKAPALEKGQYGIPTLPDGTRAELPQRDEKVWAPLAVAIHSDGAKKLIAVADCQGWQRWVRSSATREEENQGLRFVPTRPTVTVYDEAGKLVQRFGAEKFKEALWCDMQFSPLGRWLFLWPHHWKSRGLAGQPILPADATAESRYVLSVSDAAIATKRASAAISDLATDKRGRAALGLWNGDVALLTEAPVNKNDIPKMAGPSLVRLAGGKGNLIVADTMGVVYCLDDVGKELWQTNLNKSVPKSPKPWVANARATPLAPGVWEIPGGRVESDLGGQRLIEAPDGYILIEGHAGLSFEREWAAMTAVGLDPRKVKYVLATHEHGDHAPGAYLWRVVTGAKFVCSDEMAYTLQHHIPGNTGYGLHPPVPTDVRITKDTDLDLAGLKVRAVRIPGHTYGSMAWYFVKGGKSYLAFGDLIMPKGVLGYSGSVNFSASDVLSSLRKLRDLKPDVVLPGHGAVGGPGDTLAAGIEVGRAGGWGLIRPEKPDPYFRLRQKNVVVAAWNLGATSAAFGDLDGDGRPDVAVVAPAGDGARVKIFLNKGGKFGDRPDHEIPLPRLAQPSKIRVVAAKGSRAHLFVAGRSAALLAPEGKWPHYKVVTLDVAEAHQARFLGEGDGRRLLVACRFGGVHILDDLQSKARLRRFRPEIGGAYVDVQALDLNGDGREDLITSYGLVYLRGADGSLPAEPSLRLEVEKGDWSFLAVGDFNGDGRPDVALLSYGLHGRTVARVYYNRGGAARPFAEKPDAVLPLGPPTKKAPATLLRDAPAVADWDGDGIADLVIGRGQADEALILLGGRGGLSAERSRTVNFDYRVHYETGLYAGDFNGDGVPDLAAFGYTLTGVGWGGPPAAYVWLQPPRKGR